MAKGIGRLIFLGIVIIMLIGLIEESDAAKKAKSSKKEKEYAEQSKVEAVEEKSAEESVKSSKDYKKKKSQEKFSKISKKYSKITEEEALHNEPVKITKLKKGKVTTHDVYEEEPVDETWDGKPLNIKSSKKVRVNKIKNEVPTIKSKKQKKNKYVEEGEVPLEEETPKITIKKVQKTKPTNVAEEEAINENIPAVQTKMKKYIYVKLPLEELQAFKEYQQQRQQQQIVEQEKMLESVVFEDVRPKMKQTPKGVNIPVSKKTEEQEANKTLWQQVKEVVTEAKVGNSSEPASRATEEQNTFADQKNIEDADQKNIEDADQSVAKESLELVPAEEKLPAVEEDQEDYEGQTI